MYIWLVLAFIFASLEALAVSKNLEGVEYLAKPAVMVCLFLWLYSSTGLQGNTFWFGVGILFSLAGDVLLMIAFDRLFLFGLAAFLFGHLSYITGFKDELETVSAWSLLLLVFIAVSVIRMMRQVVGAMRAKGENNLVYPVIIYGTLIFFYFY